MPLCVRVLRTILLIIAILCNARAEYIVEPNSAILPSLNELESILDRAVTMAGAFTLDADSIDGSPTFNESLSFLQRAGARYSGRSVYMWGGESALPSILPKFRANAKAAQVAMPDLVIEGCVFEIVTTQVNGLLIPDYVFEAFSLPTAARSFNYSAMLFPDGTGVDQWATGESVPDFVQMETKLWFYYVATSYIDAGAEAIHFGQVRQMAQQDPDRSHTWDILSRVRAFAARSSRRGFVLCNAHVFEEGWSFNDTLLMDFHAFPSRPRDVVTRPQHAILAVECDSVVCVPFRRSAGGRTVSGYDVDALPYLVELDNWGESATPGKHLPNTSWTWGEDEIIWFQTQPQAYRHHWLQYAVDWMRDRDPRGHFEMPGLRGTYFAPSAGDDAQIAHVWTNQRRPCNSLRAGESLKRGMQLSSHSGVYELTMLADGNLVQFQVIGNNSKPTRLVVWESGTAGQGSYSSMQWDGNLVVYNSSNEVVFHSNTQGHKGSYLLLQDDGDAVIYWRDDKVLWHSRSNMSKPHV